MLYRQFGQDRCPRGRLAAEAHLVVFKALILAIFPEKGDQGDGNLHCEEDHPEVVHASYEAGVLPFLTC